MRILIVSDAWSPQVNGVVRTLKAVTAELTRAGHQVDLIVPEGRRQFPLPFYPEIPVTLVTARQIGQEIDQIKPQAIHIATEGPLGWAARRACLRRNLPFTTSFHTRFAEYAAARLPVPGVAALGWRLLRYFHRHSHAIMVPTKTIAETLKAKGFQNVKTWTRGVDRTVFQPYPRSHLSDPRPILLYAGRLAVEKGIGDFLALEIPGTKVLVGDGPGRASLERRYPQARFLGFRHGEDLARTYAAADVMVFPSKTDTFGLVMLEAMACGTPIAAYDVPSPVDVVQDGVTGALDSDLGRAAQRALALDRAKVEQASHAFSWERTAQLFLGWLQPVDATSRGE